MKTKLLFLVLPLAFFYSINAEAVPDLQLTIGGGFYSGCPDETTCASSNPFDLYALLQPGTSNLLTDTYIISLAVVPAIGPAGTDLGSFTFAGQTFHVINDMVYGTPPIDTFDQSHDPGDLSTHSVFPTYFTEYAFQFNTGNQSATYDVTGSGNVGTTPSSHPGTGSYWAKFSVDVSKLDPSVAIHFDLYNEVLCTNSHGQCGGNGDIDVNKFAPYSHDAQSDNGEGGGGGPTGHPVPEPDAIVLFGIGLLTLGLSAMRGKRKVR